MVLVVVVPFSSDCAFGVGCDGCCFGGVGGGVGVCCCGFFQFLVVACWLC